MTVTAERLEQMKKLAKLRVRRSNLIVECARAQSKVTKCRHASQSFSVDSDLEAAHVEVLKLEDELTEVEKELEQVEKDGNFDSEQFPEGNKRG